MNIKIYIKRAFYNDLKIMFFANKTELKQYLKRMNATGDSYRAVI